MKTLFHLLKFKSFSETNKAHKETTWSFFIPGINSGVYIPATLCIKVCTTITTGIFFKLKRKTEHASITLSWSEFNDLYDEMTMIKKLRDNENISSK